MFSTHVEVGPIKVIEDASGEEVKIGPLFIKEETYKAKPLLYLASNSPRFEAKIGLNYLKSKWDSQRLYLDEKRMVFIRNSEKLVMEGDSVKIVLRDYELRVHPKTVYMYSPNFKLIVKDSKIKFYSNKFLHLENESLAKELIEAINEEVSTQIKDFLIGAPFDTLTLMYVVQEVIESYGET